MSVNEVVAYSLTCDKCETRYTSEYFSIWTDKSDMIDSATDSDWTTDGALFHCDDCPMLAQCECCEKPAGADPLDRDNYCQRCWDNIESGKGQVCVLSHDEDHPKVESKT